MFLTTVLQVPFSLFRICSLQRLLKKRVRAKSVGKIGYRFLIITTTALLIVLGRSQGHPCSGRGWDFVGKLAF